MLDLYKLEIFMRVVEEGSLSSAAARLLMTQPGVSQHVADLERSLGRALFVRSPRGVRLTDAGQTLYDYAQRIARLAAEAEVAVMDVSQVAAGAATVGATPGIGVYVLAEWVQSFHTRYPNLTITLQTEITPRIVEAILARRLDVGIVEGELPDDDTPGLGRHDLAPLEHFVIVGPKHPWWARAEVALGDLGGQTLITRQRGSQTRVWLDALLAQQGVSVRIGAEFDHVESIKRAVMAGTALTILPDYAVRDEVSMGLLRCLTIADHPLQRTLKVVWPTARPLSPVARAFLRHLAARFPALDEVSRT
jgi:DNA-binding transcriptional LysR family regulator